MKEFGRGGMVYMNVQFQHLLIKTWNQVWQRTNTI